MRSSVLAVLLLMGCGEAKPRAPETTVDPGPSAPVASSEANAGSLIHPGPLAGPCAGASSTLVEPPSVTEDTTPLPPSDLRAVASMNHGRSGHVSCELPDGRVLVAGGYTPYLTDNYVDRDVEIYDVDTDRWAVVARLPEAEQPSACVRWGAQTIVVIRGGMFAFDPNTATFTRLGNAPSAAATVVALESGRLFAVDAPTRDAWISAADSLTWTRLTAVPHSSPIAHVVPMDDGRIAVTNMVADGSRPKPIDLYDPALDRWTTTTTPINSYGGRDGLLALPGGRLFLVGQPYVPGLDTSSPFLPTAFAIMEPGCNTWTMTRWLPRTAVQPTATVLRSGKVYVLANSRPNSYTTAPNVSALYDPAANDWSLRSPLSSSLLEAPTITMLRSGKIVMSGGQDACRPPCKGYRRAEAWVLDEAL